MTGYKAFHCVFGFSRAEVHVHVPGVEPVDLGLIPRTKQTDMSQEKLGQSGPESWLLCLEIKWMKETLDGRPGADDHEHRIGDAASQTNDIACPMNCDTEGSQKENSKIQKFPAATITQHRG